MDDPVAGEIVIPPTEVLIVIAPSPVVRVFDFSDVASTLVKFEPSPENEFAETEPVVDKFSSPNAIVPPDEVMDPSPKVKFPIVEPVAIVATPVEIVPNVDKASFPKEIASDEEVIDPSPKVKFPIVEPVAIVAIPVEIVPVVESASLPNVIASVEEEIDPSAKVRLPTLAPVPVIAVKVPAAGVAPVSYTHLTLPTKA